MTISTLEKYANTFPASRRLTARVGIIAAAMIFAAVAIVSIAADGYMAIATLSYGLLLLGLWVRQSSTRWHVWLMSLGISGDLALVLTLEIQRDAINTAISFSLSPLQQAHIAVSSLATALYFPTLFYGIMRLCGDATPKSRTRHLTFGVLAFLFRTLGFIFMFSLIGRGIVHHG